MNRYPTWKYILIVMIVAFGILYALPNIYSQSKVVQISTDDGKAISEQQLQDIQQALKDGDINSGQAVIDEKSAIVKFDDLDDQRKAQDVLNQALPDLKTALNLKPNIPSWLSGVGGSAMNLGLDLRGGVYFLLEVDMQQAGENKKKQLRSDTSSLLFKEKIPKKRISWDGNRLTITFKSAENADKAYEKLRNKVEDLKFEYGDDEQTLVASLTEQMLNKIKDKALDQNLTTLRKRINSIGVAEPIVQKQGTERIVVQLPGVQDTTKAKTVLDAIATLEYHATETDESRIQKAISTGRAPAGTTLYKDRQGRPVLVRDRVIATGNQLVDAQATVDPESGTPAVSVKLNNIGAARMLQFTKNNLNKPMSVVFRERQPIGKDENGKMQYEEKAEVISNATIRGVFSSNFQTTGLDSPHEATQLALLLRAGALAAPVQIVEERTIGPSLGQESIDKGVLSIQIGLALVLIFMVIYYRSFGLIADVALTVNIVLMVACLSLFGATLTLPGIAGIVLTVGMAVDANVLIFERIKEELRLGNSVQSSIKAGYDKAFSTIADANVTTFIAAVVLFAFGTGPIKGFAVTLSIGIVTSMFTAIMVSRALVNLIYGKKRNLKTLSI